MALRAVLARLGLAWGLLALCAPSSARAQAPGSLSRGHYAASCPQVEAVVLKHMARAHQQDPTSTPPLLRLLVHDCLVRGCDASILLQAEPGAEPEMAGESSNTLDGFDMVAGIKAELESVCPGVVSCADIIALAARDAVRLANGPTIPMPLGRTDGLHSFKADTADFPSSHANTSSLIARFAKDGLTVTDLVALSGAHTVGRGQCIRLIQRLPPNVDMSWNIPYRNLLMRECRFPNITFGREVDNDPVTPLVFDNQFFKNVLNGEGLFTSDAVLGSDPQTLPLVRKFAADPVAFAQQFASSLVKMSQILNPVGEIRKVCNRVNSQGS